MRPLFLLTIVITLSGCTTSYTFNSNLDPENFERYYQPSSVTVYIAAQLEDKHYQELGQVQGESCRQKSDLPPAQASDARTDARTQVAKMGGNGVVFTQCLTLTGDDALPGCLDNVICFGKALKVTTE